MTRKWGSRNRPLLPALADSSAPATFRSFRRSWPGPLCDMNLARLGLGSFGKMNLQNAVGELRRDLIFLNALRNGERPLPASPDPFMPAKLIVGDCGRTRSLALNRQDAAAHAQFEVLGRCSGQFGGEKVLAVKLVQIDGRILPLEANDRKRKGQAFQQPIDLPFEITERFP